MKICVTGGCGFIGSHLVDKLLSLGHEVHVVDRKLTNLLQICKKSGKLVRNLHVHINDIRDPNLVYKLPKFDVVFHLAALINAHEAEEKKKEYRTTNVEGTSNMLWFVKPRGKFIFLSSIAAKPKEKNFYGMTKRIAEMRVEHYSKEDEGYDYTIVRPYNVFGPRQKPPALIAKVFQHIRKNKPFPIKGHGEQVRSFVYVKDLVRELVGYMYKKKKKVEVGSKHNYSVNFVFNTCKSVSMRNPDKITIEASELSDLGISKCNKPIKHETYFSYALMETWYWWEDKWIV